VRPSEAKAWHAREELNERSFNTSLNCGQAEFVSQLGIPTSGRQAQIENKQLTSELELLNARKN
jgi:hypothetical protein